MGKVKQPSKKQGSPKNLFPSLKSIGIRLKANLLLVVLILVLATLSLATYQIVFSDKFFPRTYVGDTDITFLTKVQAKKVLDARFSQRANQKLAFTSSEGEFEIELSETSASLDYSAVDQGFETQRTGSILLKIRKQLSFLIVGNQLTPKVNLNLDSQIERLSQKVYKQPENAQLIFNETTSEGSTSANIQLKYGKSGLELDEQALKKEVERYLLFGKASKVLPIKTVRPVVDTAEVERAKKALESIQDEPIKLIFNNSEWTIDTKQLLGLLDLTKGKGLIDAEKGDLFLQKIAQEINQPVQEGLFEFNPNTKRVSSFKQSQEGRQLDVEKTVHLITQTLEGQRGKTITLPVITIEPKVQTSNVNNLGIQELLGRGVSHFAGSIQNRIYNVALTAQKLNGVLIPPGETFSFNNTVGDISSATGFKQAYVIKEGRTVLDDGGGVCQASTTIFRAALNAGLPITKRTAHAYRVSYYEQGFSPGLDATIFHPSVDFQFKNDTPSHILIQAWTEGTTLYIDLYGTSDGRVATLTKSIVTNQAPPPAELRQDDPTLPKGEVKQVDWAAWGATVTFSRTVERNGQTLIQETFRSNYRPWQAVYLVGTRED